MSNKLVGWNVVIAAHQFNPSIVSQTWLLKHKLVTEEDFRQGYMFTDALVQIQGEQFNFLLVEEQLQFQPKVEKEREQELILSRVGAFVTELPHTPYKAVGLNFLWNVTPDLESVRDLSRRLFFREETPLFRNFEAEDAKFGAYFSRDVLGCRLRLEVKPILLSVGGVGQEHLHFAFNFNLDLGESEDPVASIESMLAKWDDAKRETIRIVQSAEQERST